MYNTLLAKIQRDLDNISKTFANGIYISCKYDNSTLENLEKWINQNRVKIPNPINITDTHTTVVYSRKNFISPHVEKINNSILDLSFFPKSFKILGKPEDQFKALALVLHAPYLEALHNDLLSKGAVHDFDDYIPHVTLSYGIKDNFNLKSLPIPNFVFKPSHLAVEPLNEEWASVS